MGRVRVASFSISIDGYGAGPDQSYENPLGAGGRSLLDWLFATRTQQRLMGNDGGTAGVDETFAARGFENVGAWIMGRNMFGPIRGPWPGDEWKGWWGDNPPFHVPVFVLTHHPRDLVVLQGGTSFHFVADGIHAALDEARRAANGKDVRIGGGVATIQQYLRARLVDELHIAMAPSLLGSGEHLFGELNMAELGYVCTGHASTDKAIHVTLQRA